MKGVIYILSNPSMEGLVKIGYTTKTLQERLGELNSATGIPTDFVVEAFFELEQPEEFERLIHKSLRKHRIRKQREFFKLEKREAIRIVRDICHTDALRNVKIAPVMSVKYTSPRSLTPEQRDEKREFKIIMNDLWLARKATFVKSLLTDPNSRIPLKTLPTKIREFFTGDEHDFRRVNSEQLSSCRRIVTEMNGDMDKAYIQNQKYLDEYHRLRATTNKRLAEYYWEKSKVPCYILRASPYSVVGVSISSAIDLHPDRIKLILTELQKHEREIYTAAKEIYENRYKEKVDF